MNPLVYAIQREEHVDPRDRPRGIEGAVVSHLVDGGLAAVFSMVPRGRATPDVSRLLDYARVVEELSQRGPVLPMRYGCLPDTTEHLGLLLRRNRQAYRLRLESVDGCVEMGVRVFPNEPHPSPAGAGGGSAGQAGRKLMETPAWGTASEALIDGSRLPTAGTSRPGIDYLTARKNHFEQQDSEQATVDRAARNIQAALAGLFVRSEIERAADRRAWPGSIHFLIRREETERFVAAFHQFEEPRRERLLLTGPWPPYNFVA